MIPHPGPPANGAGGPSPSVEALGGVEETPPAIAGGSRPPAQAGGHPPNANALGGLGEVPLRYQGAGSSRASKLRKVAREESGVTGSVIGTSASSEPRPVRSKQPIAYLHESAFTWTPPPRATAISGSIRESYAQTVTAALTRFRTSTPHRGRHLARRGWSWSPNVIS